MNNIHSFCGLFSVCLCLLDYEHLEIRESIYLYLWSSGKSLDGLWRALNNCLITELMGIPWKQLELVPFQRATQLWNISPCQDSPRHWSQKLIDKRVAMDDGSRPLPQAVQLVKEKVVSDLQITFANRYSLWELQETNWHIWWNMSAKKVLLKNSLEKKVLLMSDSCGSESEKK